MSGSDRRPPGQGRYQFRRTKMVPGLPAYEVLRDGVVVGTVWQRRGGYWTASGPAGKSSSWYRTRKEATEEMLGLRLRP